VVMKRDDTVLGVVQAILFAVGSLAVIIFALGFREQFKTATDTHPFVMGFLKLFFLGTFGELLKYRISRGSWSLNHIIERAIVWGIYGLWFTLAFAGFAALVDGLVEKNLWPSTIGIVPDNLWIAFSQSMWINLLGMYAWGMMVGHEWCNHLINSRWRSWSLRAFAEGADKNFVLAFIPKTLLFWIPAHTFTFAMPAAWRVFIAAMLAIVLGFLLSVGRKTKPA
jgi:hypothetical protein